MVEEINLSRRRFLDAAAITIAAGKFGVSASAKTWFGDRGELSALANATTWLNSQPLTAAELHGKVVLIDFWTYSCINWRRTASFRPRVGRKIQESRIGGDRGTCA